MGHPQHKTKALLKISIPATLRLHPAAESALVLSAEAVGKQGQHLEPWEAAFSLFVHAPGSFKFPRSSLFSGREIKQRVAVEWGQWTVVSHVLCSIPLTRL